MHAKETVYIPVVVAACLLAVGCSSTPELVCTGEWLETGRLDGANGIAGDRIERYVRDCASYEVVPDQAAYERGRQEGLAVYCTPENGYELALNIQRQRNVCPFDLLPGFRSGYSDGEVMRDTRRTISNLNRNKRDLENDIRCATQEIDGGTSRLGVLRTDSESNASRQARVDIERLTEELERLNLDIDTVEEQCTEMVDRHQALNYRIEATYCHAPVSEAPPTLLGSRFENSCVTSGSSGSDDSE